MMILSQNENKIISTDNLNYIELEKKELNYQDYVYLLMASFSKDSTIQESTKQKKEQVKFYWICINN